MLKPPQPVSMLFELCQKNGQQVDIKQWRQDDITIANVYIDSKLIASVSSDQYVNVKLHAARAALEKLTQDKQAHHSGKIDTYSSVNGTCEIKSAKGKLNEVCLKKKWPNPIYRYENLLDPNINVSASSVISYRLVLLLNYILCFRNTKFNMITLTFVQVRFRHVHTII